MANLLSIGSGNWTSASTWGLVDNTSFLDSTAGTSFATGGTTQSFTPGAITLAGIALQLRGRTNSPSGTFNVALFTGAASVAGATVTINVSDLPFTNGDNAGGFFQNGWTYFKFASDVTLLAATSYYIRATAGASQVAVYRNATASNWTRALVTTTTQAPVTGDYIIVAGEYTAASTNTTRTVVMDNTTAGLTMSTIYAGNKGILTWGTASASNYVIGATTSVVIARAGEFYMGSSASRIPDDSTATLRISSATLGAAVFINEGIFTMYGATVTHTAKLVTNEAVGSTVSSVNITTGWKSGSSVVFPSTGHNAASQTEVVTLTADAIGATVFHSALVNAHGGSASTYVQADLGNLSRNVRVVGASATVAPSFVTRGYLADTEISYGEIRNFGSNTTTRAALTFGNGAAGSNELGSLMLDGASIWMDNLITGRYGINIGPGSTDPGAIGGSVSISITNSIVLNYGIGCLIVPAMSFFNSPLNITGNLFYRTSTTYPVTLGKGYTFENNVVAGGGGVGGVSITMTSITDTFSGNTIYSNVGNGFLMTLSFATGMTSAAGATYSNNTTFRNTNYGAQISNSQGQTLFWPSDALVFNNLRSFGNLFNLTLTNIGGNLRFLDSHLWAGDTTLSGNSAQYGLVQQTGYGNSKIDWSGGAFGMMPSGVTSSHATANIAYTTTARLDDITITGATFTGTDLFTVSRPGIVFGSLGVVALNYDGFSGTHRAFTQAGTISTDTVIINNTSQSMRMAPGIGVSYYKLISHIQRIPVSTGNTCTVTVFVRKSVVGDGTAYNGTDPRLILRYNSLAGNLVDVIGATASGAAGSWQQLSYTTPAVSNACVLEFYIDCDGTAGWINVADWATTTNINSRGINYWSSQGPYVEISNVAGSTSSGGGGGSFTFVS